MMAEPGSARERKVQGVCHRQGRAIVRQALASCEPKPLNSMEHSRTRSLKNQPNLKFQQYFQPPYLIKSHFRLSSIAHIF